jgi:hypothetical protein
MAADWDTYHTYDEYGSVLSLVISLLFFHFLDRFFEIQKNISYQFEISVCLAPRKPPLIQHIGWTWSTFIEIIVIEFPVHYCITEKNGKLRKNLQSL